MSWPDQELEQVHLVVIKLCSNKTIERWKELSEFEVEILKNVKEFEVEILKNVKIFLKNPVYIVLI